MDQTGPGRTTGGNRAANRVEDVATRAHETIDKFSDRAGPAVDRLSSGAHELVETAAVKASDAADTIDSKAEALRETQLRLTEQFRDYVKEKPLVAVGLAVAAGFVLSKLLGS